MGKTKDDRGPDPKSLTLFQLCAAAAGRCQFDGCNQYLFRDELTLAEFNKSNIAHIVASSPKGPRGDLKRSHQLSDKLSNLMLMCPIHHKEIDAFPEKYTEDILLDMKLRHETAISEQCGMIYKEASEILLFSAAIKGRTHVTIDFNLAAHAIMPSKRVASLRGQRIAISAASEYRSPQYWDEASKELMTKFYRRIGSILEDEADAHFSIFPLAPIPLIIKLGYLIGDKVRADIFQYHRASDSWIWPAHGEVNTFLIETCKIRDGKIIALIFSLTADIAPERVMSVFDADVLFFVKARHTGVDCIQSPEDLANFWGKYQEACDIIKNVYPHTNEVSVFSAMPASAAFEVGRKYMPGVYPKLKIYDEDNGFFETITIGGID